MEKERDVLRHGNKGRAPANVLSDELHRAILQSFDLHTLSRAQRGYEMPISHKHAHTHTHTHTHTHAHTHARLPHNTRVLFFRMYQFRAL